jgi:hypothetical protein
MSCAFILDPSEAVIVLANLSRRKISLSSAVRQQTGENEPMGQSAAGHPEACGGPVGRAGGEARGNRQALHL